MLRSAKIGIAILVAATSVGAVAAPLAAAPTGVMRNQAALAMAGRPTPFVRAGGQVCARQAGAGQLRVACTAAQSSNFAVDPGTGAVAAGTIGAVTWGTIEALRHSKSN